LATLFVDDRFPSKVIQSADIEETVATLVRITGILSTQSAGMHTLPGKICSSGSWSLKEFNGATKKAAAEKLRGAVRTAAFESGAAPEEANSLAIAFGSMPALQEAFRGTAPAARAKLLCPLLYSHDRLECDGACCKISAAIYENVASSVGVGETDATIQLSGTAPAGAGRRVRMIVSAALAVKRVNMQPPTGWEVAASDADRAGGGSAPSGGGGRARARAERATATPEWLLVRAENAQRYSRWFCAHLVGASVFETAITTVLQSLTHSDAATLLALTRGQLAHALCSSLVLALARQIAAAVIAPLAAAQSVVLAFFPSP
jgi:hypothetical protein